MSSFNLTRQAWKKLGTVPAEDATQKYIDLVTELYPSWSAGSSMVSLNCFSFICWLSFLLLLSYVSAVYCAEE